MYKDQVKYKYFLILSLLHIPVNAEGDSSEANARMAENLLGDKEIDSLLEVWELLSVI